MNPPGLLPWHVAGFVVDDELAPGDVLARAWLAWEVELRPVYTLDDGALFVEVPDRRAVVRMGSGGLTLGVVGTEHQLMANSDVLTLAYAVADQASGRLDAVGEASGGRMVWAVVELADRPSGGLAAYLLLTHHHSGVAAPTLRLVSVAWPAATVLCELSGFGKLTGRQRLDRVGAADWRDTAAGATQSLLRYRDRFDDQLASLASRPGTVADVLGAVPARDAAALRRHLDPLDGRGASRLEYLLATGDWLQHHRRPDPAALRVPAAERTLLDPIVGAAARHLKAAYLRLMV